MAKVTVYGADWCAMTTSALDLLKEWGVDFDYVDVEDDLEASEWVKEQNGGKEKKPTIDVDGEVLRTPSESELKRVLQEKHLLTARQA